MGKGETRCGGRSPLDLGADSPGEQVDGPPAAGRSERARHLWRLLTAAGVPEEAMLRDPATGRPVAGADADVFAMANAAISQWAPSSYPGHAGSVPAHEPVGNELYYTLMLDGDRRAQHTFFYNDKPSGRCWTIGAAQAARGWYRLPCDDDGLLVADGLGEAVARALDDPRGPFVSNLVSYPAWTLAQCADRDEPGAWPGDDFVVAVAGRGRLSQPNAGAVIDAHDATGADEAKLMRLRVRDAGRLIDAAGLGDRAERDAVLLAAAFSPPFGAAPDPGLLPDTPEGRRAGELLVECAPALSDDGLPVLAPSSRAGRLLADAQQGWMASLWCDVEVARGVQALGVRDDLAALERARQLCARSPFHSPQGRKLLQRAARRQETRLRSLVALARGSGKPKRAEKLPPLTAAG